MNNMNYPSDHHKLHDHEHRDREAVIGLRAALGSILSPKRPSFPHSHSHPSSGTASPHPFTHSHSHQPAVHTSAAGPGSRTDTPPVTGPPPPTPSNAMGARGSGQQGHLQVPPHSGAHLPTYPGPEGMSSRSASRSPARSEDPSPPSSPGPATPPSFHHHAHLHPHSHHTHSPLVPPEEAEKGMSGAVTPNSKAKFLATLQGKSAWDAMVHGSWV